MSSVSDSLLTRDLYAWGPKIVKLSFVKFSLVLLVSYWLRLLMENDDDDQHCLSDYLFFQLVRGGLRRKRSPLQPYVWLFSATTTCSLPKLHRSSDCLQTINNWLLWLVSEQITKVELDKERDSHRTQATALTCARKSRWHRIYLNRGTISPP